jgi:DNA-binding NarL/FixJ family response regulator
MIQLKYASDLQSLSIRVDVLVRMQSIGIILWDKHPTVRATIEGFLSKGPTKPMICVDFKEDIPKSLPPLPVKAVLVFDGESPKAEDMLKIWAKCMRVGDQAIAVLSQMDRNVVMQLAQQGVTGVLIKPFSAEQLRQKLQELVNYPTDAEISQL